MKKALVLLSLLVGLASAVQAQGVRFGVKAGASLTNYVHGSGADYKPGFHGGLMANVPITKRLFIHPELLYSMKGWRYPGYQAVDQTLNYLDLPVVARIKSKNLFFEVGPQLGFLLNADGLVLLANDPNNPLVPGENRYRFNQVDFGYVAGLGYQLPAGPGIGLRYNGGFRSIYQDYSRNNNVRNSAFQLYLSYQFGGK